MFFLPESPRFLIEKERYAEAQTILHRLHFDGSNAAWIESEYTGIRMAIEAEKKTTAPGWMAMFTVPQWRTRLLFVHIYTSSCSWFQTYQLCRHGVAVQVFTQMTGINVIGYYQTIMYKSLGITGSRNTLVAGIYNCVGPLANLFFVVFILDRVGRLRPMLFATVAISLALICEATLNSQNPEGNRVGYSIGGVFFIFLVSIIFSMSFGPCSW